MRVGSRRLRTSDIVSLKQDPLQRLTCVPSSARSGQPRRATHALIPQFAQHGAPLRLLVFGFARVTHSTVEPPHHRRRRAAGPVSIRSPHSSDGDFAAPLVTLNGRASVTSEHIVVSNARRDRTSHLVTRLAAAAFESLLHAIDANDPETGAHVRRVAAYAVILARAADENDICQHRVERVALFHDIGKINGALFDVLRGSVALTAGERRLIATHADRGAEVVQPLASFYPELPAGVRAHHEWWNGRGYPHRLRGNAIPFEARVVAIADVFDALTHRRLYKTALSVGRADEFIAAGRGTQFDPDLTDLFLSPPVRAEIKAAQRAQRVSPVRAPRGSTRSEPRRQAGRRRDMPEVAFRWRATKGD
jgi:HD-GYP domain-containing protein (c-di-GMP phosphodiesterase class II)